VSSRLLNVLTLAGLAGLLAGAALSAPRWAGLFRRTLPVAEEDASARAVPQAPETPGPSPTPTPSGEARRTISAKLFFEARERRGLVAEERTVPFSSDLAGQIRGVVEALVEGSQAGLVAPLHPSTRVLEVFVTARGIAYLDLSKDLQTDLPAGSEAERLAVYSIVNTVVENFPAVRRVQILIDDRPVQTLAGHVDLSHPLPPDMTLLAPAEVAPAEVAPPPEAPPAAPAARPGGAP
jgi:hypothetical protein